MNPRDTDIPYHTRNDVTRQLTDNTPPLTDFQPDFIDNVESANGKRCVYGTISPRSFESKKLGSEKGCVVCGVCFLVVLCVSRAVYTGTSVLTAMWITPILQS